MWSREEHRPGICEKESDSIVLQADQVGHEVMEPEGSCYRPVVELFGSRILRPDGTIDRGAVAAVVFSDGEKLAALNGIIHPAVKKEIFSRVEKARRQDTVFCSWKSRCFLKNIMMQFAMICGILMPMNLSAESV